MAPQFEKTWAPRLNPVGRGLYYSVKKFNDLAKHALNNKYAEAAEQAAARLLRNSGFSEKDIQIPNLSFLGLGDAHEDPIEVGTNRSAIRQSGQIVSTAKSLTNQIRLKSPDWKSTLADQLKYLDRNCHVVTQSSLTVNMAAEECIIVPYVFRDNLYCSTSTRPRGNIFGINSTDLNPGLGPITDAAAVRILNANQNFVIDNSGQSISDVRQLNGDPLNAVTTPTAYTAFNGSLPYHNGQCRVPVGYYQPYNISDLINLAVSKTDPRLLNSWAYNDSTNSAAPNFNNQIKIAENFETSNVSTGTLNGWSNYIPRTNSAPYICSQLISQDQAGTPSAPAFNTNALTALRGSSDTHFRCTDGSASFNILNTNIFPVVIDVCIVRCKKTATKTISKDAVGLNADASSNYAMSLPHCQALGSMSANVTKYLSQAKWTNKWASMSSAGVDWIASLMQPNSVSVVNSQLPNSFYSNALYSPNFSPFPCFKGNGTAGATPDNYTYPVILGTSGQDRLPVIIDTSVGEIGSDPDNFNANRYTRELKKSFKLPAGSRLRYNVKLGQMELDLYEWTYSQYRGNAPAFNTPAQSSGSQYDGLWTTNETGGISEGCDEPGETVVVYFKISGSKVIGARETADDPPLFRNAEMTAVASKVLITCEYREDFKTLFKVDTPGRMFVRGDWKKPGIEDGDQITPAVPIPVGKAVWAAKDGVCTK